MRPLEGFRLDTGCTDGYRNVCGLCRGVQTKAARKRWEAKNPDKVKIRNRKSAMRWRKRHPEEYKLYQRMYHQLWYDRQQLLRGTQKP